VIEGAPRCPDVERFPDAVRFGDALARARRRRGLSQVRASIAAGVSATTVSAGEAGRQFLSLRTVLALCKVYRTTLAEVARDAGM
jgi:transcriptional regulator with XRE-family HTH domain